MCSSDLPRVVDVAREAADAVATEATVAEAEAKEEEEEEEEKQNKKNKATAAVKEEAAAAAAMAEPVLEDEEEVARAEGRAFGAGAVVEVCSDTGDDGSFVGAWLPAVVVSATPNGWSRSKRPADLKAVNIAHYTLGSLACNAADGGDARDAVPPTAVPLRVRAVPRRRPPLTRGALAAGPAPCACWDPVAGVWAAATVTAVDDAARTATVSFEGSRLTRAVPLRYVAPVGSEDVPAKQASEAPPLEMRPADAAAPALETSPEPTTSAAPASAVAAADEPESTDASSKAATVKEEGLTDGEARSALELFDECATKWKGTALGLNERQFTKVVLTLVKESTAVAKAEAAKAKKRPSLALSFGGFAGVAAAATAPKDAWPVPKEKDLAAAFREADEDGSGFVDRAEFAALLVKVKTGKVKGLGGSSSMFKTFFGSPLASPKTPGKGASSASPASAAEVATEVMSDGTPKDPEHAAAEASLLELLNDDENEVLRQLFKQAKPVAAKKGDGVPRLGKKEFGAFFTARAKARKVAVPQDRHLAAAFALADAEKKGGLDEAAWVRFGALTKRNGVHGRSSLAAGEKGKAAPLALSLMLCLSACNPLLLDAALSDEHRAKTKAAMALQRAARRRLAKKAFAAERSRAIADSALVDSTEGAVEGAFEAAAGDMVEVNVAFEGEDEDAGGAWLPAFVHSHLPTVDGSAMYEVVLLGHEDPMEVDGRLLRAIPEREGDPIEVYDVEESTRVAVWLAQDEMFDSAAVAATPEEMQCGANDERSHWVVRVVFDGQGEEELVPLDYLRELGSVDLPKAGDVHDLETASRAEEEEYLAYISD